MDHTEYHGNTSRISKSGTDKIAQSPAHYWANYLDPNKDARVETRAMFEGTAIHTLILEPHTIAERYTVLPPNAPSRACLQHRDAKSPSAATLQNIAWWDKWNEENGNRTIIENKAYTKIQRIKDSVYNHPAARWLLERPGITETPHTWDDFITDAPCKCMPDKRLHEDFILMDIKSTENASPSGFSKSVVNYRYDVQGAFYMDGFDTGMEAIRHDDFIFIAVEKEPPYAVGVYRLPDEAIKVGRDKYLENLRTYMECKRTGIWPAYSDMVVDLTMPKYYFKQL